MRAFLPSYPLSLPPAPFPSVPPRTALQLATVFLSLSWFYRDVPGTVDTCLGPLDGAARGSSPAVLVGRGLEPSSLFMSAVYEIGLMVASIVTLKKGLSYVTDRVERRCHTGTATSTLFLELFLT